MEVYKGSFIPSFSKRVSQITDYVFTFVETKDREINKINVGYSCDIIRDLNELHIYKNIGSFNNNLAE